MTPAAGTIDHILAAGGLIVTIVAVLLSAALSARAVAKACMRREHEQIANRAERLEAWQAAATIRLAELERRAEHLEIHVGWPPSGQNEP